MKGKQNRPKQTPPSTSKTTSSTTQSVRSASLSIEKFRSAPLPDPKEIEQYERLIPNGADRIMAQWELETRHRHATQRRTQNNQLVDLLSARFIALLFALACLAVLVYCVSVGATWPAVVIGGALIVAGVNSFLQLRK